jgi:hypothetical protein
MSKVFSRQVILGSLSHFAGSLLWVYAYEFFEPWITSKLIEHRIKPEQRRS